MVVYIDSVNALAYGQGFLVLLGVLPPCFVGVERLGLL